MNLSLHILQILKHADGHLLPMSTLVAELRLRDRNESLMEIRSEVEALESRDQVVVVFNEDTGRKVQIADAGRARLAQANL